MPRDSSSSNPRFQWERYTERSRLVIQLAQKEARTLRHDRIDTAHLLLGLLREREGVAARVLADVEIDEGRVRAAVTQAERSGDHEPSGQLPFTESVQTVLESALKQSKHLGDAHLGTEHLLLALAGHSGGDALAILMRMGVDAEMIETRTLARAGHLPRTRVPPFDRFTTSAHKAVVEAQEHARTLRHQGIEPPHLLLGILRSEQTLGCQALNYIGLRYDDVLARVEEMYPQAEAEIVSVMSMAADTKTLLEFALHEALQNADNHIGTEHLALACVRRPVVPSIEPLIAHRKKAARASAVNNAGEPSARACSFCGTRRSEVNRMIERKDGPARLCDSCLRVCSEILGSPPTTESPAASAPASDASPATVDRVIDEPVGVPAGSDRETCAFCDKTRRQVKTLIGDGHSYICDECVIVGLEVLGDANEAAR